MVRRYKAITTLLTYKFSAKYVEEMRDRFFARFETARNARKMPVISPIAMRTKRMWVLLDKDPETKAEYLRRKKEAMNTKVYSASEFTKTLVKRKQKKLFLETDAGKEYLRKREIIRKKNEKFKIPVSDEYKRKVKEQKRVQMMQYHKKIKEQEAKRIVVKERINDFCGVLTEAQLKELNGSSGFDAR